MVIEPVAIGGPVETIGDSASSPVECGYVCVDTM